MFRNVFIALVIITILASLLISTPALAQTSEQPSQGSEVKTEQSGSPAPAESGKPGDKKTEARPAKKISNTTLIILIVAPVVVIGIMLLIMLVMGSREGSDVVDAEKKKEKEKGRFIGGKGAKRLQLALELLDHQKISREGNLETDFFLRCIDGANRGEEYKITKYVSLIGRRSTDGRLNDIELSSLEKEISRKQAMLVFKDDTFYLVNESDVPIQVGKQRVREAFPLQDGDEISFAKGKVVLKFSRKTMEI